MILFDIDNTLLDFKGAEYQAVLSFYKQYGEAFSCREDKFYLIWV